MQRPVLGLAAVTYGPTHLVASEGPRRNTPRNQARCWLQAKKCHVTQPAGQEALASSPRSTHGYSF